MKIKKEERIKAEIKQWKPKLGGKYYWLSGSSAARGFYANLHKGIWADSELDQSLLKKHNCFRSIKEARFIFNSFNGAH